MKNVLPLLYAGHWIMKDGYFKLKRNRNQRILSLKQRKVTLNLPLNVFLIFMRISESHVETFSPFKPSYFLPCDPELHFTHQLILHL